MGQEREASYYDRLFTNARWNQSRNPKTLPWAPVWQRVADEIEGVTSVVDVGCGPGSLLHFIPTTMEYTGMDFSPVALQKAVVAAGSVGRHTTHFVLQDLRKPGLDWCEYAGAYVFCEVLEHVENDIDLLYDFFDAMNAQHYEPLVVITVPNFDDPSHVRHFGHASDVHDHFFNVFVEMGRAFRIEPIGRRVGNTETYPWFLLTTKV